MSGAPFQYRTANAERRRFYARSGHQGAKQLRFRSHDTNLVVRHLPALRWQPSEADPAALASITDWVVHAALPNVLPPLCFDLAATPWPVAAADAVVAINVLHYSPWPTTPALFAGAAEVLPAGGVVVCYGPYRRGGAHTAPSNAEFDEWLRSIDARFAVRNLETVEAEAQRCGFVLEEVVGMPANNLSLVFRRGGGCDAVA